MKTPKTESARKIPSEKIKFSSVDEYHRQLPSQAKKYIAQIRDLIKEMLPAGEHVISYNIPAVKMNGKPIIYYSAWKEHISIYPSSVAMEKAIEGLDAYMVTRGTLKFPLSSPLPVGIIRKIVKFKIREFEEKQKISR